MLDKSLFVSTEPFKRTVTLADGSRHVFHIRELPVAEYRKFGESQASDDEDVRAAGWARIISSSVRNADGTEVISAEQADMLKPGVAKALMEVIEEVNGLRKKPGKR